MLKKLPFLVFLFISSLQAQEFDFSGSVNLQGVFSNQKDSPFWLHSNKRGRINEATTFAGWGNFDAAYVFNPTTVLRVGTGVLYRNGYEEGFELDELYLDFQKGWFSAVVGRKQRPELYSGLSATNENILWSLNARPMPGLRFFTNRPVFLSKDQGLGFEVGLEEYWMDDDRYVDNTRVHYKRFHLVYSDPDLLELKVGFHHFAQWGGTSPDYGKLPSSIDDYFKVIQAQGMGGDATDGVGEQEVNGLGNHLGSYEVNLKTFFYRFDVELFWNHIFEDGSGSHFKNFPDGRYGFYVTDTRSDFWVDRLIYEFYYTRDQSNGSLTSDGGDNYFNNHLYRSGWTYESKVLGSPFFTLDNRFRIGNNTFYVHHFGIAGTAGENLPFKLMTSFRRNYGYKGSRTHLNDIISSYLEVEVLQAYMDLKVQLATDFATDAGPNFGLGLSLSKSLF